MGAEADGFGCLLGDADAPFGDHRPAEPHGRRQQLEIGIDLFGTAGIAGHGGADHVDAELDGGARLGNVGDVGHGQLAVGMDGGAEVGDGGRADAVGGVEGDDVGAGLGKGDDVIDERRDAHRRGVEVALDEADDRRVGGRPHGLEIVQAFDAQATASGGQRRQGETDHLVGMIEGAVRHRLAGDDE